MLLTRVIPILLIEDESLVKTKKFKDSNYLGDPFNAVTIFNEKEVDEIIILDIGVSKGTGYINFDFIENLASQAFMPLAYGGGINTLEDIDNLFAIGVDKVILNSVNFYSLALLRAASKKYGSQSIVASIDVKKSLLGKYQVFSNSGCKKTEFSPVDWAKELELSGAGELIVNAIDKESTFSGYDLNLIKSITDVVNVPVVVNGGAKDIADFALAKKNAGASAVAAGSMFVYHGKHNAVLITYPSITDLETIFNEK